MRCKAIDYTEADRVYSVTVGVRGRVPVFRDLRFGLECVALLREVSIRSRSRVLAYCLMPDHVHLLLGISSHKALPSVLGAWKSLCYQARRRTGRAERFWQRSFFDHAMRADEDLRRVAEYILNNPVRAGLAADFRKYPLCGSFELDL